MKLLFFLLFTITISAQKSDCLNYEQKVFDSDSCCWRKLAKARQFEASANLIINYLEKNKAENRMSLNWHAGQMFTFAGKHQKALHYFGKTYSVFQKWFGGEDGKTWYYFAKGTSAFVKRDKEKLDKIIKHWENRFPKDKNYKELKRLQFNWNMSYEEATKIKNNK